MVPNMAVLLLGSIFRFLPLGFLGGSIFQKKTLYCLGHKGKELSLPQINIKSQLAAKGLALDENTTTPSKNRANNRAS